MHLVTFDLNNLHKSHFLESRHGRYYSSKATEQFLVYNFALTFRPPKSVFITKTRPCNIQRFFTAEKMTISVDYFFTFSYFCSKHRLWVQVRTASLRRFLTSSHNLCFRVKIRKMYTLVNSSLLYKSGV